MTAVVFQGQHNLSFSHWIIKTMYNAKYKKFGQAKEVPAALLSALPPENHVDQTQDTYHTHV